MRSRRSRAIEIRRTIPTQTYAKELKASLIARMSPPLASRRTLLFPIHSPLRPCAFALNPPLVAFHGRG